MLVISFLSAKRIQTEHWLCSAPYPSVLSPVLVGDNSWLSPWEDHSLPSSQWTLCLQSWSCRSMTRIPHPLHSLWSHTIFCFNHWLCSIVNSISYMDKSLHIHLLVIIMYLSSQAWMSVAWRGVYMTCETLNSVCQICHKCNTTCECGFYSGSHVKFWPFCTAEAKRTS